MLHLSPPQATLCPSPLPGGPNPVHRAHSGDLGVALAWPLWPAQVAQSLGSVVSWLCGLWVPVDGVTSSWTQQHADHELCGYKTPSWTWGLLISV